MSHNVRLSGVKFTDMTTLAAVVAEVSGGTARLDMDGKTFRTYFDQPNKCDALIVMTQGHYDFGLQKQAEGHYTPIFESGINSSLGTRQNPLGKVQQEYMLREAEYEASQRGMTTERITGANGRVTLRCEMAD